MARSFEIIKLQLGDSAERYMDETLRKYKEADKLPPWIIDWTHHKKWSEEDKQGVDFTIHTDLGDIQMNVKSSLSFAKQFADKHKNDGIIAIVVNILEDELVFYRKFMYLVSGRYHSLRKARTKKVD